MDTEEQSPQRPAAYRIGDLVLDLERERVLRHGTEITLSPLSFALLRALAERAPELVPVRTLMDEVWPALVVGPETVSQRVKLVRAALADSAERPTYISSVRGRGYRLVTPVIPLSSASAPGAPSIPGAHAEERTGALMPTAQPPSTLSAPADAAALSAPDDAAAPSASAAAAALSASAETAASGPADLLGATGARSVRAPGRYRWTIQLGAGALAAAGAVALLVSLDSSSRHAGAAAMRDVRIAVLPLENLSPDPADAFFAAGMHEDIIGALARLPGVEVVSRTTMTTFAEAPRSPISAVATQSGATHVVEGSVRRDEQHVRISLQLVDAAADASLWSQTYDKTLGSALTLQSEIAADVASRLGAELPGRRAALRPATANPEAYDAYLQGLFARAGAVMVFTSAEAVEAMEAPLARAVMLDPDFAAAQAELAVTHLAAFMYNIDPSEQRIRHATQALEKAEQLSPRDPKVLAARGAYSLLIRNDPAAALQAFRSARSAGLADALWLQLMADTLVSLGQVDEAVDVSLEALAMDPRNASVITMHAIRLARLQRPIEAYRILERAVPELPETTVLPILSKQLYFWHTGELEPLEALVRQHGFEVGFTPSTGVDPAEALRREAEHHRLGGRIGDLRALLDGHPHSRFRSRYLGAGDEPLAEMQGWASLLADDRAGADAAGRAIAQFLADTRETEWNRAYRSVLAAEAYLFSGELALAAEAAQAALALHCSNGCSSLIGEALAAALAWSGAEDEAVQLLRTLARASVLGPALITRDPLYSVPLADNAGYRELAERLEARMRANRLTLGPAAAN